MNLGELRTLLREAILHDRTDRIEGDNDYLWTDNTLNIYINEAQRRFATRGLVLRDATTDDVTKITLVAGQAEYVLHPAVFAVISAKVVDQSADLTRTGHSVLAAYRAPADNWIDPATLQGLPPGPVLAFSTDEGLQDVDSDGAAQVTMRVHPVPSADAAGTVIRLRVCRKPIDPLASDSQIPEIPEDHHIEMLDWAAYLALRIVDDDAGSPKRAADFMATFDLHVKEARTLAMRKLFAPVGWGFGRGGYSWDGN